MMEFSKREVEIIDHSLKAGLLYFTDPIYVQEAKEIKERIDLERELARLRRKHNG